MITQDKKKKIFLSSRLLVQVNDYCFYKINEHRFRIQTSYHFTDGENTLDHITLRRSIFIMDKTY